MKKLFSLVLCLVLTLCFCACKRDDGKVSLIHGTTEGNKYSNSFADITFTAPEGWSYMTDSELLAVTEDSESEISDEKLQSIFDDVGLAYDMTAYCESLQASVGIVFANTDHEEFEGLSAKEVLSTMIEQIALEADEAPKEETVTICGKTYTRLCLTTKTGTGDVGYATFYGREKGNSVIMIIAACTDAFTVADCEACFR